MFDSIRSRSSIEPLEARIAPATVLPTVRDAELAFDADPTGNRSFVKAQHGTAILLTAGQVLSTSQTARDGTYLLLVEKGSMFVFLTDLNNNNEVDFNEITGIAAGDGLRFTSFVDIHGDIVTNFDADRTLSDSNNNAVGDDPFLKGDGRVLNNSTIEAITLRSLAITDLTDQNGDDAVDLADVGLRLALSSYSIHGQVLAGKGFGVVGDITSGLLIDTVGGVEQATKFDGPGLTFYIDALPTIGAIRVGTAASGEYFSFGISRADNAQGTIQTFTPLRGVSGGDIYNVRAVGDVDFNVSGFYAGDGGIGARGGNIDTVIIGGDNASGYQLVAGNGGSGSTGATGGSILGFTDRGSVTGQVLLAVGNGGNGTTGAGGNGGTLGLGTVPAGTPTTAPLNNISVNAGFTIELGDGGSGFTNGGNGASITKVVINTEEGAVESGLAVVSTTRDGKHNPADGKIIRDLNRPGIIGRTIPVDFDQDGFSDVVFTTANPNQLIVQFGDGFGGFRLRPDGRPDRIYLDGPVGAEALAVGDFNGDGHQDIAVASSDVANYAGLTVFLAKWEDANANGLTPAEDTNLNRQDDFLGFYTGRTSPLPSLASGDPDGGPFLAFSYGYYRSASAINDLVVGDFDGDGYTEIAVSATYLTAAPNGVNQNQIVMVLTPDIEDGRQTGQFYADVGTRRTTTPSAGANPFVPFVNIGGSNDGRIEATALSSAPTTFSTLGNVLTYDVIVGAPVAGLNTVGNSTNTTITSALRIMDFSFDSPFGPSVGAVVFDPVDTDRRLGMIGLTPAFVRDFTIVDFNQDGSADFVAITEDPDGEFVVGVQGDGLGNGFNVMVNPGTADNSGLLLTGAFGGNGARAIRSTELFFPAVDPFDLTDVGVMDDIVIHNHGRQNLGNGHESVSIEISVWNFLAQAAIVPLPVVANPGFDFSFTHAGGFRSPSDSNTTVVAFDTFVPRIASTDNPNAGNFVNYLTAVPTTDPDQERGLESLGDYGDFLTPLVERFVEINAGDGGDGIIGRGGNGGLLGGTLSELPAGTNPASLFGAINITLPVNRAFEGQVRLTGGDGGNGFTSGGTGGGVFGARVSFAAGVQIYHTDTVLTGGDGGTGVSGAGGNGGSLVANSLERGSLLQAGDGGRGKAGGNGGSIIGHGRTSFPDNREPFQIVFAGDGGNGVIRGGHGGSVTNFHGLFDLSGRNISTGIINYVAGDGGSAVSGPGGNGGDVTRTSPFGGGSGINRMKGDVYLRGGDGGNGLSGGRGGDVSDFTNRSSETDGPTVLSFLGGSGGDATRGNGGRGGNVSNIIATSTGAADTSFPNVAPLEDGLPAQFSNRATVFTFNRILAGDGGVSSGAIGGVGGGVSNISSGNVGNPFAIAAGAGGAGLREGGRGGSVATIRLDIGGGDQGKALIVAGAGGDAGAFIPNTNDPAPNQADKAFGGRVGKGGDGGSIRGVTQLGSISAHVDLIAGNGGDTVFYGRVGDIVTSVGRGGSISGVFVDGNIGNVLPDVPIKSYNDLVGGESMAQFVTANLRDRFAGGSIGDDVGNVGIVVGAAGRLKAVFSGFDDMHRPIFQSLPAFNGGNGSLSSAVARSIMSAVAGSVDRIASILTATNVSAIAGEIGTDKTGLPDFKDKFGNAIPEPVLDGMLVDGAMVVSRTPVGGTRAGNIFVLA